MNEQRIRQIIQEEIKKSQTKSQLASFKIQRHVHNNTDAPYIQGVSQLSNGSQDVLGLNSSKQQIFSGNSTVYPIPVLTSQINGDVDFQGGKAPIGTMVMVNNPNQAEEGILWICVDGTNWYGFISNTGL